jgi:hypothetical protein
MPDEPTYGDRPEDATYGAQDPQVSRHAQEEPR